MQHDDHVVPMRPGAATPAAPWAWTRVGAPCSKLRRSWASGWF